MAKKDKRRKGIKNIIIPPVSIWPTLLETKISIAKYKIESDVSYGTHLVAEKTDKVVQQVKQDIEAKKEIMKEEQYVVLEEMCEVVKEAYVLYVARFTYVDGEISPIELNRLYSLMARIKVKQETRMILFQKLLESVDELSLINNMEENVDKASQKALRISLLKDMIMASGTTLDTMNESQKFFLNNTAKKFNVTDSQLRIIEKSIELENEFLNGKINESKFVKGMKELSDTAANIGFPIAAIYLSGSVIGVSAAGITSGLASLGLSGILGFGTMMTGVGTVFMVAMAGYSGIKWLKNHGGQEKANKREYLITEAMKNNQEVISALIEDINYLANELNKLVIAETLNKERINKLQKRMAILSEAVKNSEKKKSEMKKELSSINS